MTFFVHNLLHKITIEIVGDYFLCTYYMSITRYCIVLYCIVYEIFNVA